MSNTSATPITDRLANLIATKQFTAAEQLADRFLAENPRNSEVLNLAGIVHLLTARHESAIRLFEKAIQITPLASEYHANLGNALRKRGHAAQAETALRKALALGPESKEKVLYDLGNLLQQEGRLDEAAELFRAAILIAPNYAKALNDLAMAAKDIGTTRQDHDLLDEALDCLARLRAIAPEFPRQETTLALVYREKARLHALEEDFETAKGWSEKLCRTLRPNEEPRIVLARKEAGLDSAERTITVFHQCRLFPGDKDWFVVDAEGCLRLRGLTNANPETGRWCCVGERASMSLLDEGTSGFNLQADRAFLLGGGKNYWHWLIDYLPRLAYLAQSPDLRNVPLVVNRGLTKFQKETLKLLGINESRLIQVPTERVVHCQELSVTPIGFNNETYDLKSLAWLKQALSPSATTGRTRSRRIYVSRGDAQKRQILNEQALTHALSQMGFEPLELGRLRVREQIAILHETEILVGLHGGAFANLIFGRPDIKIVELVPANSVYPKYIRLLSKSLGIKHVSIPCTIARNSDNNKVFMHDHDVIADVRQIVSVLTGLLG